MPRRLTGTDGRLMGRPKVWTGPCAVAECGRPATTRGWCQKHYYRWSHHGDPRLVSHGGVARTDVVVRILRRVNKNGPASKHRPNLGPCWIWLGYVDRHGYGQVNLGLREGRALVHRVVYMRLVGAIPDGLELDHLCRVPACCNPDHLEPVTHAENIRRGDFPKVLRAKFAAITACGRGHLRTADNIRMTSEGRRRCRACCREWAREGYSRRKEIA